MPRAKHVNGPGCPACEAKIITAHPTLQPWLRRIRVAFEDAHYAWVWRGEQDQNQCVKDGTSELRWPMSAHNAMMDGKPASRACDIFQLSDRGTACWPWPYYSAIAEWLMLSAAPIDWGYTLWKKDGPHFQLRP